MNFHSAGLIHENVSVMNWYVNCLQSEIYTDLGLSSELFIACSGLREDQMPVPTSTRLCFASIKAGASSLYFSVLLRDIATETWIYWLKYEICLLKYIWRFYPSSCSDNTVIFFFWLTFKSEIGFTVLDITHMLYTLTDGVCNQLAGTVYAVWVSSPKIQTGSCSQRWQRMKNQASSWTFQIQTNKG